MDFREVYNDNYYKIPLEFDYQIKFNHYLLNGNVNENIFEKYINIHQVNVNFINYYNVTPLIYAVINQQWDIVNLLLLYHANVNETHRSNLFRAPIHFSVFNNDLLMTKLLIQHNCDLNVIDSIGKSALHLACQYNYPQIVRLLVKSKADVNAIDFCRRTPIFYTKYFQIQKFLITQGAELDVKDADGFCLVHKAIVENNHHLLKLLVQMDIDKYVESLDGIMTIHLTYTDKILDILHKFHVELDRKDANNRTLLHVSCRNGHYNIVKRLFKYEVMDNINEVDNCNETPLHIAMCRMDTNIIELLLQNGAHIYYDDEPVLNYCSTLIPNDVNHNHLKCLAFFLAKHNINYLNTIYNMNEYQCIQCYIGELISLHSMVFQLMANNSVIVRMTYLEYLIYEVEKEELNNITGIRKLMNEEEIITNFPNFGVQLLYKSQQIDKWCNEYKIVHNNLGQQHWDHKTIRLVLKRMTKNEISLISVHNLFTK